MKIRNVTRTTWLHLNVSSALLLKHFSRCPYSTHPERHDSKMQEAIIKFIFKQAL